MTDRWVDPGAGAPSAATVAGVRRASTILKVLTIVLAVGSVVGSFVSATTDLNQFYGGPATDLPWRIELANFLQGAIPNLAWSALVLAAAFALELGAAVLERRSTVDPAPSGNGPAHPPPVETPLDDSIWRP